MTDDLTPVQRLERDLEAAYRRAGWLSPSDVLEREIDTDRETDRVREDRDRWVRLFNRLDAAISHHKAAERFPDDHDEALWAARDRILRAAAAPDETGER